MTSAARPLDSGVARAELLRLGLDPLNTQYTSITLERVF
jgi:hypothetical protein